MNTTNNQFSIHSEKGTPILHNQTKLKSLAYRLLGTVSDAEDAVQETYLRWYKLPEEKRSEIAVPLAWKRTALTRVCLDKLKSAKARREAYVGQWLPEPLSGEHEWLSIHDSWPVSSYEERMEQTSSVSMALMIVLENMTPPERVCFILHDVFHYAFSEISEIVERSPEACRQLAFSARKRIGREKRLHVTREEHAKVNAEFILAWTNGDVKSLIATLDGKAGAITDGGGRVAAALNPVFGTENIAKFFVGIFKYEPGLKVEHAIVNGDPGFVGIAGGRIISVISTLIENGVIRQLWVMRNPEKMSDWQRHSYVADCGTR